MIRVPDAIRGLPAKMLLQVHDELLFEVAEDAVDETIARVRTVMESGGAAGGRARRRRWWWTPGAGRTGRPRTDHPRLRQFCRNRGIIIHSQSL